MNCDELLGSFFGSYKSRCFQNKSAVGLIEDKLGRYGIKSKDLKIHTFKYMYCYFKMNLP